MVADRWFAAAVLIVATAAPAVTAKNDNSASAEPYGGTIAMFENAPTLDGTIEPGEWRRAMRIYGFQHRKGGDLLERRKGVTYIGFTEDRLYIAVASELPPDGEVIDNVKGRDAKVIDDDSLDIWLDTNRANRERGEGDRSYFQNMISASGAIMDQRYSGEGGAPDKGWDGGWDVANGIRESTGEDSPLRTETGLWTIETSIPFEDIGLTGSPVGKRIGVLVARMWNRPGGQMPAMPHSQPFSKWSDYPVFTLTKNGPTVQVLSFGEQEKLFAGSLNFKARILNPGPARRVKVRARATSSNMPGVNATETLKLPAHGQKVYEFNNRGRFHANAEHRFEIEITSADGQTDHFRYAMDWRKPSGDRWNVKTGPEPAKAVKLAYYPSYGFVRVYVDPTELGEKAHGIQQADVKVVGPDGKKITAGAMRWDTPPAEQRFEVGELDGGTYTAKISLKGHGQTYERRFVRKHFPWEGNTLGEGNEVLPPFEPVERNGDRVEVVLRRHKVSGLGFWESVEAKGQDADSEYRPILAGPMRLRTADGKALDGDGEFVDRADDHVTYKGSAERPSVRVETRTVTEFDGCMRVEMTLKPGEANEKLDGLYLDIPVRDAMAPLFHCTTTSLRSNPVGATPSGNGRVWDSRELPDGNWHGNFHPYLWVGGEERGICWFADNDKNWVLDTADKPENFDPCQELVRKDGVLHVRIHFVQKPVKIERARKIVFGLMASPAKPMRDQWRNIMFEAIRHKGVRNIEWIGAQYWGSPSVMYNKYPINGDMSVLEEIHRRRLGEGRKNFLEGFTRRNLTGDISDSTYRSAEEMRSLVKRTLRIAGRAGTEDFLNVYWEEFHRTLSYHPEVPIFKEEWSGNYSGTRHHSYPESYLDFACYYGAKFIRNGIGLYFDNTFPKRGTDPVTTNAYRLPNGRIQPSAGMWRHRRYLKRIWTLHEKLTPEKTPTMMMLHMTNTHIVPYMVFNHSNLDLEWFYGPEPAQAKYSHDMLRAQSLGLQTGNIPLALASARKHGGRNVSDRKLLKARRTRFGALMVHEIRPHGADPPVKGLLRAMIEFGYGTDPDTEVTNYWDADRPVEAGDGRAKWLLMENDGRLMMLVATWNGKPSEVRFDFDTSAIPAVSEATDVADGNAELSFDGQTLTLPLERYGVRLIRLK